MKVLVSAFLIVVLFSCDNKNAEVNIDSKLQNKFDTTAIQLNNKACSYLPDNPDSAIHYLKKSIQTDETYRIAYGNLTVAYSMIGQLDSAISISEKLIELEPLSADYWVYTGMLYENSGDKRVALDYYNKGIDLYTEKINSNPDKYYYENKMNRAFAYILVKRI